MMLLVDASDPISQLFAGHDMTINGYFASSIQMAFWIIIFVSHNRKDLAEKISTCDGLIRQPCGIYNWVASPRRDFVVQPNWNFNLELVYYTIMCQLLEHEHNSFTAMFRAIAARYAKMEVTFAACTPGNDYVWTTALNKKGCRTLPFREYGGNLYGKVLSFAYKKWIQDKIDISLAYASLRSLSNRTDDGIRHTVLLLSDSQCKYVSQIYNGAVVSKSGGRYHRLAQEMAKQGLNPCEFKFVIVNCGVNHCRYNDHTAWRNSWNALKRALRGVLTENSTTRVLLNLPVWNPKAKFIAQHNRFMQSETSALPNLWIYDWSLMEDNPFILKDTDGSDRPNLAMYTSDKFHVNHKGFRRFWNAWCVNHRELLCISYNMSAIPYTAKAFPRECRGKDKAAKLEFYG